MKTARLTLLITPEFKAFLGLEAARSGISVGELVCQRCEQKPTAEDALQLALAAELHAAVREAQSSLSVGLAEANAVLADLRGPRHSPGPTTRIASAAPPRGRKASAGVSA